MGSLSDRTASEEVLDRFRSALHQLLGTSANDVEQVLNCDQLRFWDALTEVSFEILVTESSRDLPEEINRLVQLANRYVREKYDFAILIELHRSICVAVTFERREHLLSMVGMRNSFLLYENLKTAMSQSAQFGISDSFDQVLSLTRNSLLFGRFLTGESISIEDLRHLHSAYAPNPSTSWLLVTGPASSLSYLYSEYYRLTQEGFKGAATTRGGSIVFMINLGSTSRSVPSDWFRMATSAYVLTHCLDSTTT